MLLLITTTAITTFTITTYITTTTTTTTTIKTTTIINYSSIKSTTNNSTTTTATITTLFSFKLNIKYMPYCFPLIRLYFQFYTFSLCLNLYSLNKFIGWLAFDI